MEDLGLAAFEGISVSISPNLNGNLVFPSSDRNGAYTAEEILKGLGDPREHVNITSSYQLVTQLADDGPLPKTSHQMQKGGRTPLE